ncbi:hypothetical protein HMPREF1991_02093 [Hoylesella loescheii DSM 19665 = JCM 12249 = ATCC 15930]|uniref:Uncharacterized protein n=1 Tax=Hoylesella loescheii DSM 19665 = JCM 12249 = ATCC 15930 TaxID=1122985 RepID=A0A069QG19_HOYLO|nr:hypothetical protein HMPREF1991_02093 [Hoylesella loescheii DSM 19665 = JCM 12249 = ATCC 15930]
MLRTFGRRQELDLGPAVGYAKIRNVSKRRNKSTISFNDKGKGYCCVWIITIKSVLVLPYSKLVFIKAL